MDKNTLSNYGWIVAVILVLAIMITMATPFASTIKSGVEEQVTKFKGTAGDALDNAGNASSFDDLTGGGSGGGTGGGSGSAESRSGIIPAGAVYTTAAGVTLTGDNGDSFPETMTKGDTYEEGDYIYGYQMCYDGMDFADPDDMGYDSTSACFSGWAVHVIDDGSESFGKILSSINGKPTTSMNYAFYMTQITEAPAIPNGVISISGAFQECMSLTTAPTISSSVTDMTQAFSYCSSLTAAPVIPSSVTSLNSTFDGCTSLTGTIEINANPDNYYRCLAETQITEVVGSTSLKAEILNSKNDEV